MQPDPKAEPPIGLLVAMAIAALWLSSLEFLLRADIKQFTPLLIVPAILGRTFIQSGLFIVAHDAIHGVVLPRNLRLNHWVGQFTLMLYALLPYQKLSLNHWQHHHYSGRAGDPDFHDGVHSNLFAWYLKFMKGYLDMRQRIILLFGMSVIVLILQTGLHVPVINLFLFWILPIALSSMQLFFFGTYLPHRSGKTESNDSHHAISSNYSVIWSFLACYHFGYHWEHHEYPFLPWYRLPAAYQDRRQKQLIKIGMSRLLIFRLLTTTSSPLTLLFLIACF